MTDISGALNEIDLATTRAAVPAGAAQLSGRRGKFALLALFVMAGSGYGLMFLALDTLKSAF